MNPKGLVCISVALSSVLGLIAALTGDYMWLVIDVLSISLLVLPHVKDMGFYYDAGVVRMTLIAPVLVICIFLIGRFTFVGDLMVGDLHLLDYMNSAIESLQCFVTGFMLALVVDRGLGYTLTRGWMVLFALVFSMTVIAMDFFFMLETLYLEGYPVFNEDYANSDRTANSMLMATPTVATFVTAFLAVWLYKWLRNESRSDAVISEVSE